MNCFLSCSYASAISRVMTKLMGHTLFTGPNCDLMTAISRTIYIRPKSISLGEITSAQMACIIPRSPYEGIYSSKLHLLARTISWRENVFTERYLHEHVSLCVPVSVSLIPSMCVCTYMCVSVSVTRCFV